MSDAAPSETRCTRATGNGQPANSAEPSSDTPEPSSDSAEPSGDTPEPSRTAADTSCDDGSASPERRLERYLARRAEDGEFYFKGKFIADDVGLTPSQIGTFLAELREADTAFEIEPWSYSNATTWWVRPDE